MSSCRQSAQEIQQLHNFTSASPHVRKSAQEPTAPPIETHLRALFVRARLARSLFFYYSLYNGRGIFYSEDVCQVRMVAPRFIFHPHLQLLEPAATKM